MYVKDILEVQLFCRGDFSVYNINTDSINNDHTQIMLQVTTKKTGDKPVSETVEVALNPEELDMDTAAMQAKYDQTVREQQSQLEKEDLSDMVAEHAAKQKVC